MNKKLFVILLCLVALGIMGCGQTTENSQSEEEISQEIQQDITQTVEVEPTEAEDVETEVTQEEPAETENDILIAYFTWADNTHVENPENIDVDATTSASVLAPGNAEKLAVWIQEEVGGDLFSIQVEEPYSSDYDACLDRAADEKADNARPTLSTHVENMEQYDVIFLGFPNWWYTLPMPIHSFLEEYDFEGKTVIPFCTHGTGGLASTIVDLESALPQSTQLLEPIGVYRPDVDSAQPQIQEWIRSVL